MPRISNEELAKRLDAQGEDIKTIKDALLGDLSDKDKPGFLERLRTIEKWQGAEKWLMSSAIITALYAVGRKFIP